MNVYHVQNVYLFKVNVFYHIMSLATLYAPHCRYVRYIETGFAEYTETVKYIPLDINSEGNERRHIVGKTLPARTPRRTRLRARTARICTLVLQILIHCHAYHPMFCAK